MRWTGAMTARATLVSVPTRRKSTSAAPTRLSSTMNPMAAPAPRRTRWPGGETRRDHTSRPSVSSRERPLVRRWKNSMNVATLGLVGIGSPLQVGQWAPQPSPEPVACTTSPHTITARVKARVSQA